MIDPESGGLFPAEDRYRSLIRPLSAGEDFYERGFTRPILAYQAVYFAGRKTKLHVIKSDGIAEGLCQVMDGENFLALVLVHLSLGGSPTFETKLKPAPYMPDSLVPRTVMNACFPPDEGVYPAPDYEAFSGK